MAKVKNIKLIYNTEMPESMQFGLEYDGWCFTGSFEEILEQFEGMLANFEHKCKEENGQERNL